MKKYINETRLGLKLGMVMLYTIRQRFYIDYVRSTKVACRYT